MRGGSGRLSPSQTIYERHTMTFSIGFADALDFIAEETGHHPACVHLVGKHLATELSALGFKGDDTEFLLILHGALTEGGICAGEALVEALLATLFEEAHA